MTASIGQRLQDHEAFILGELFPLIMSYARISQTPNEVVTRCASGVAVPS